MRRRRRARPASTAPLAWAVGLLVLAAGLVLTIRPWRRSAPDTAAPSASGEITPATVRGHTFDGDSRDLTATRIVPTRDAPLEDGRNVVWCASLQMAWNTLRRDVVHGPIDVQGAPGWSARLNAEPGLDVPGEACWSWAGPSDADGVEAARASFARWRPGASLPALPIEPEGVAALAALEARVSFAQGFNECDRPLAFRDAAGRETGVRAFGLRERDDYDYMALRRQVRVLHAGWTEPDQEGLFEVVIDPDRTSAPYQVVLGCVEPRETLAATWAYVRARLREPTLPKGRDRLMPSDTFLVPEMSWRVVHRIRELEGRDRTVRGAGGASWWLALVRQEISFRLDRSGAVVSSPITLRFSCGPGRYEFDRPFLVAVKGRTRQTPFFLMWVANAELLRPMPEDGP